MLLAAQLGKAVGVDSGLEEIKDTLQERISECTGARQVDVIFLQILEESWFVYGIACIRASSSC